jgi:transposase
MYKRSSLTENQRATAVALFETGEGYRGVARQLGANWWPVKQLHERWRVRGSGALVTKRGGQPISFELKLDVVQRFLAGETKVELAKEFGLSSPKAIDVWLRKYRDEGEDGLRSKRRGRPPGPAESETGQRSELEQLRAENERLRAEVAYLGKLRALRAQERR